MELLIGFIVGLAGVLLAVVYYGPRLSSYRHALAVERDARKQVEDDLQRILWAARPFANKTTYSFTGFGPHDRVVEVQRNEAAEELRKTIAQVTGMTLRPESLEEAGIRSIDPHKLNELRERNLQRLEGDPDA